jgi:hypothetical protein
MMNLANDKCRGEVRLPIFEQLNDHPFFRIFVCWTYGNVMIVRTKKV